MGKHCAQLDDALIFLELGLFPFLQFLVIDVLREFHFRDLSIGGQCQFFSRFVILVQQAHIPDRQGPQFLLHSLVLCVVVRLVDIPSLH